MNTKTKNHSKKFLDLENGDVFSTAETDILFMKTTTKNVAVRLRDGELVGIDLSAALRLRRGMFIED